MLVQVRSSAATLVAAMVLLGMFGVAAPAWAQPCTSITVTNNVPGAIRLVLDIDQPGGPIIQNIPAAVPPVPGMAVVNVPLGAKVVAVQGATGISHPFPAQPPRPACAQIGPPPSTNACIGLPAVTPPPTVYCGTVCYDDSTCTMTIYTCPVFSCGP